MGVKKSMVWSAVALLLLFVAYVFVSPYLVAQKMRNNVNENDITGLAESVDFEKLEKNLKNDLSLKKAAIDHNANGAWVFLGKMADKLSGVIIEHSLSTPHGVFKVLSGQREWEYSYDSLNVFSIWNEDSRHRVQVILERSGLSWKVTNIMFHDLQKK